MPSPIRFEISDRVATLTLDRPDRLNALVPEMKEGFEEALAKAAEPGVKVLLLRGAGRAFCAGGDIGWMAKALAEGRWRNSRPPVTLALSIVSPTSTSLSSWAPSTTYPNTAYRPSSRLLPVGVSSDSCAQGVRGGGDVCVWVGGWGWGGLNACGMSE